MMNNYFALGYCSNWIDDLPRYTLFPSLKQYALLFDKIGILNLDYLLNHRDKFTDEEFSDAIWLKEQNIIFSIDSPKYSLFDEEDNFLFEDDPILKFEKEKTEEIFTELLMNKPFSLISEDSAEDIARKWPISRGEKQTYKRIFSYLTRAIAHSIEYKESVTAIPLLAWSDYSFNLLSIRKSIAISVVINHIPIPDNNTPWEQIIEYRNDTKNQESLLALRRWISKISREAYSAAEIEEEIEWLINEFQQNMKLKRIQANSESLETIVKAPLELAEDLVKLKFSKIPEPFFALRKRKISLMEAELTSPGKEIAFLINTNRFFK